MTRTNVKQFPIWERVQTIEPVTVWIFLRNFIGNTILFEKSHTYVPLRHMHCDIRIMQAHQNNWSLSLLGQLINTYTTILATFSFSFCGCCSLLQEDVSHKNEASAQLPWIPTLKGLSHSDHSPKSFKHQRQQSKVLLVKCVIGVYYN